MSASSNLKKFRWNCPDPESRRSVSTWLDLKNLPEPDSDAIQVEEIPKSASFHNWMRNQREAFEFLHPNSKVR